MKDPVKQFEELDGRINNLFEAWFNPKSWFSNKPSSTASTVSYGGSSLADKIRHRKESGEECGGTGNTSNKRFYSEDGSNSAKFYSKKGEITGEVDDIKPFIDGAKISKKYLRCYNLTKDPLKIAWLFNGNFKANVLGWNPKTKKVTFQGKWKGGVFMGEKYAGSEETPVVIDKKVYGYYVILNNKSIGQKNGKPFTASQIIDKINRQEPLYYKLDKITKQKIGDPTKGVYDENTIIRQENLADPQYVKDNKTLSLMLNPPTTTQSVVVGGLGGKQRGLAGQIRAVSTKP
jgi:hypothetical protein